jgi:DNA polymerase III subunit epsilon
MIFNKFFRVCRYLSTWLKPTCSQAHLVLRLGRWLSHPFDNESRMPVKSAILSVLSPEALKEVCGHLDVDLNYRTKAPMVRHLLRQESISAEKLLPLLTDSELQAVCAACGVPVNGRKTTLTKRLLQHEGGPTFVAIDFETADYPHDSACAVGLARVENHRIMQRAYHLIRPPRKKFSFTSLHGITWHDVAGQPTFAELWPSLTPILKGVDFLAAHNASFDRSVLRRCCAAAGVKPPRIPFRCTVQLARQTWNIYPTKLNNVCDQLGITLKHHFAASDAEACALIVIAAHRGAGGARGGK